jgi:hypothetical protein
LLIPDDTKFGLPLICPPNTSAYFVGTKRKRFNNIDVRFPLIFIACERLDFRQVGSRQQRSTILAWPCKFILVAQNLSVASKNLQWPMGGKAESRCHLDVLKVNKLRHSYLNVMKSGNYEPTG